MNTTALAVIVFLLCMIYVSSINEYFGNYCKQTVKQQRYTGHYGDKLSLGLNPGDQQGPYIHISPTNKYIGFDDDNKTALVFKLLTANGAVAKRIPNMIYLHDVFNIYSPDNGGGGHVVLSDNSQFKVDNTSPPALFTLHQKYSTLCNENGIEYDTSDINNRNIKCEFPYTDCIRRCGMRKLLVNVNGKWETCGKAKNGNISYKHLGGWQTYEFMVLTVNL